MKTPRFAWFVGAAILGSLCSVAAPTFAQIPDQPIYNDALTNNWVPYGWATINYSNTTPIHSGADSVSVNAGGYQAIYVHHSAFDSTPYRSFDFWINGGSGGQTLHVQAELSGTQQSAVTIGPLQAGVWQHFSIPLTSLGAAQKPNLDGFWIQNNSAGAVPIFYLDDITLVSSGAAVPTSANISVDASRPVRILDPRLFGINTAVWDNQLGNTSTLSGLTTMGMRAMRYPGGSTSDGYNWSTDKVDGNANPWPGNLARFNKLSENAGTQPFFTVNYGNGTPEEAAAWVAYENALPSNTTNLGTDALGLNWKTAGFWASLRGQSPLATDDGYNFLRVAHANPYGARYWEIGNEVYGSWEYDKHGTNQPGRAHDPYTYAAYAAKYIPLMKSVDPAIKIGVVSVTGEDAYGNGTHGAVNKQENGSIHTGWTPVMLRTLADLGQAPDFIIDHEYAQSPGYESDSTLLQASSTWPAISGNIRTMLSDYFGSAASAIEVTETEVNSVSSAPGKQTTSLVNGLYYADTLGALGQTSINSCLWWNLHNAAETNHNNSASLYGWRTFGDYGVLSLGDNSTDTVNTFYPTAYAAKLLTNWAHGGDQTATDTSDYNLLASYASVQADGTLAILLVNKSSNTLLTGHVTLTGFVPSSSTATVVSYGMGEDNAKSDLTTSSQTVGSTFDTPMPPYSIKVIRIQGAAQSIPAAPASCSATAIAWSQITVSWPIVAKASSYSVYRSAVSGGPYSLIASGVTGQSFTDTNAQHGSAFYYVVSASNRAGEGARSAEASATTSQVPLPLVSLAPAADNYVQDGNYANTNFGSSSLVIKNAGTAGYDRATYLKFDLTRLQAAPVSAKLTLLLTSSNTPGPTSTTVKAYGVADTAWNESQMTWNSALASDSLNANLTSSGTYIGSTVVSTSQAFYTWDLSSYLKDKAGKIVTILLTDETADNVGLVFNSREASFGGPSLAIDFGGAAAVTVTSPLAPTGLTVGSVTSTSVPLSWSASTGATSYDIFRATTSGGPYTHLASAGSSTSYTDQSVTAGTKYYYVVNATNSGGSSPYSSEVNAMPPPIAVAPPAPTGLAATPVGSSEIDLAWSAASGASGYSVYRSTTTGGPYAKVTTQGSVLTYKDVGLASGTTYYYTVTALNGTLESVKSSEVSAATPAVVVGSVTLNPVADAYVNDGNSANSNFGSAQYLVVKNAGQIGANRVSYMTFDLTTVKSAPKSAKLTLTATSANSLNANPATISVYGISNTSWTELGLTWNNAVLNESLNANCTSGGTLAASASVLPKPGTTTWDISSYLANKAGKLITLQVICEQPVNVGLVFGSRESGANQPVLSLSF